MRLGKFEKIRGQHVASGDSQKQAVAGENRPAKPIPLPTAAKKQFIKNDKVKSTGNTDFINRLNGAIAKNSSQNTPVQHTKPAVPSGKPNLPISGQKPRLPNKPQPMKQQESVSSDIPKQQTDMSVSNIRKKFEQ